MPNGDDTPNEVATDTTGPRARYGGDTFKPTYGVPDRFERHVRDDHAPNAVLHATLKAAFGDSNDTPTVNLMGSHAPGEKPNGPAPTYHVWVESENTGMGHPKIPDVVRRLVDRDKAKITDVVECSDDHLIVSLRPVEARVEPVEVPYDAIPDDLVDLDDVEHTAARTLRKAVDEYGADSDRANAAARALATTVYVVDPDRYADDVDEPEAAPLAAYRELWRRAGVDPDTRDVSDIRPTEDGHLFEGPEDDRTRDVVEAIRDPDGRVVDGDPIVHTDIEDAEDAVDAALRYALHGLPKDPYAGFPYTEVGEDFPVTRPPVEPIREWVDDHRELFDTPGTLTDDGVDTVAEMIADAIENFVVYGDVDPDIPDGATQEDVEEAVEDTNAGADE